jgi:hypothetical protein
MTDEKELLKQYVRDLFAHYKDYVRERLEKQLRKKMPDSELLSGLETLVEGEGFEQKASVIFADFGRVLDMKRKHQIPPPSVAVLEKWVRKKGLGSFDRVPGYADRFPIQKDIAIKRIASAVAWGMRKKVNRVPWYSRTMYRSIGWLTQALAEGFAGKTAKTLAKKLKKKGAADELA